MNNLKLVETDVFNEIATCDFWGNANNEYLIRVNPLKSIV